MSIETIVSAVIGGVFGGGITLLVAYLQSKSNIRRDYIKIAHELALEEFRTKFEVAKMEGGKILPLEAHIAYYSLFIKALERKDFSPEKLEEFRKAQEKLHEIYREEMDNL